MAPRSGRGYGLGGFAGHVRLWAALAAVLRPCFADLVQELYQEAKRSRHMKALALEDMEEFTGPRRPQPNVMVLFHEASCHICQDALPKFQEAAKELGRRGVPVEVGHLDCSTSGAASEAKRRFGLQGFPSLLFWRALSTHDDPAGLVGQQLRVAGDAGRLARASRSAGMAEAKDAARLKAMDQLGEVLEVDRQDMTAKLQVPGVGRVWLPLEVLQDADGHDLPHQRADAAFHCDASLFGGWRKEAMQSFAERMAGPAVAKLDSLAQLAREMREEESPAVVFCGDRLPPAFVEMAAARQGTTRAFHAEQLVACPTPLQPQVVIYSPAEQQWSQQSGDSDGPAGTAAVAASGADVVGDPAALSSWLQSHRFVGFTRLNYNNFFAFVKSQRRALVVAVDAHDAELNPRIERRLTELAGPAAVEDRRGLREFADVGEDEGYSVGVVDGSLSGLEAYGVFPGQLPHVIVMLGPDLWVEDTDELTVWGLPSNLAKVPGMWRMSRGLRGYLAWFGKHLGKSYSFYRHLARSVAGTWGDHLLHTVFAAAVAATALAVFRACRSLVAALLSEDAAEQVRKEE